MVSVMAAQDMLLKSELLLYQIPKYVKVALKLGNGWRLVNIEVHARNMDIKSDLMKPEMEIRS